MFSRSASVFVLSLLVSLAACKGSVVNDAPAPGNGTAGRATSATQSAAQPASQSAAPGNPIVVQATPATTGTPASASTPAASAPPALKEAMKNPGVPMAVPDSMRRPATKEEMEQMMKHLPPEVRQRIMGMQTGQAPAPTPKKN